MRREAWHFANSEVSHTTKHAKFCDVRGYESERRRYAPSQHVRGQVQACLVWHTPRAIMHFRNTSSANTYTVARACVYEAVVRQN